MPEDIITDIIGDIIDWIRLSQLINFRYNLLSQSIFSPVYEEKNLKNQLLEPTFNPSRPVHFKKLY